MRFDVGPHAHPATGVGAQLLERDLADLPNLEERVHRKRRHLELADLVLVFARDEVGGCVRPARDLEPVLAAVPRCIRGRLRIGEQIETRHAVLRARRSRYLCQDALHAIGGRRCRRRRTPAPIGVGVGVLIRNETLLGIHAPPCRPRPSALGRDDDDAGGRRRAVERRGRGTLDDLDRLDLLGVDVVDPAGIGAADPDAGGVVVGGHADAVDDVQRLIIERQAVGPADPHA